MATKSCSRTVWFLKSLTSRNKFIIPYIGQQYINSATLWIENLRTAEEAIDIAFIEIGHQKYPDKYQFLPSFGVLRQKRLLQIFLSSSYMQISALYLPSLCFAIYEAPMPFAYTTIWVLVPFEKRCKSSFFFFLNPNSFKRWKMGWKLSKLASMLTCKTYVKLFFMSSFFFFLKNILFSSDLPLTSLHIL